MYDLISIGNISIDLYFKGQLLTFEKNRFQQAIGAKFVPVHPSGGIASIYHFVLTFEQSEVENNKLRISLLIARRIISLVLC